MKDELRLRVIGSADPALQARVWDWSMRNLYWLFRDRADVLDRLDGHLDVSREASLAAMPVDALNVLSADSSLGRRIDVPPFDEEARRRCERWLVLSALALGPGLDRLLAEHGATLERADHHPTPSEALAELGVPHREPLRIPELGRPAELPWLVLLFHVGELPITSAFEKLHPIDPRARGWPCVVHASAAELPNVMHAIPEGPSDADHVAEMAALRLITRVLHHKSFHFAWRPSPTWRFVAHATATMPQLEAFYREHRAHVLRAPDLASMNRAWAEVQATRAARLGDLVARRSRLELWDDAERLSPRDLELPAFPGSFLQRLARDVPDLHDTFGALLERASVAGIPALDVLVAAGLASWRWDRRGSWIWHLAAALRDREDVRVALREAGFTRGHLLRVVRSLRSLTRELQLPDVELSMECADPAWPSLPAALDELLRATFPLEVDGLLVDIEWAALDETGALRASLAYVGHVEPEYRRVVEGCNDRVRLEAAELADPATPARLAALFAYWRTLPRDALVALLGAPTDPLHRAAEPVEAPAVTLRAVALANARLAERGLTLEVDGLAPDRVLGRIIHFERGELQSVKDQEVRVPDVPLDEVRYALLLEAIAGDDHYPEWVMPADLLDWSLVADPVLCTVDDFRARVRLER
jgi:hypothetical protein